MDQTASQGADKRTVHWRGQICLISNPLAEYIQPAEVGKGIGVDPQTKRSQDGILRPLLRR
jgi:hypothetical protein